MSTRTAFTEYNIEQRRTSLHGSALVGSFVEDGPGPHATIPHRHDFVELVWLTARTPDNIVINLAEVDDASLPGYRRR